MESLKESTALFKQTLELLKADKQRELEEVREIARAKRFHSALLMHKASQLEAAANDTSRTQSANDEVS